MQAEPAAPSPLGESIRARRSELGMSQAELAAKARISPSTVYRWEHGDGQPAGDSWRRLARALEMTEPQLRRIAAGRIIPGDLDGGAG